MDIDEFLEKEAKSMGGKAQIMDKEAPQKHDNENLFDQLEAVRKQLKENNLTSALQEFDYLKSRYTDMTKKQLSENRYIFNELIRINQEIIKRIDNQRGEFDKRQQMIRKLHSDATNRFNQGEYQTAYKLYIEINEIIKNMSDIFSEEKNRINYELLSFSAALFPRLQQQSDNDFRQKKNVILQEIYNAYQHLKTHNGQLPTDTYEKINKLFQQLPEGHIYEKAILYNDILKLFRSSSLSGETNALVQQMLEQQQGYANQVLASEQSQQQPQMSWGNQQQDLPGQMPPPPSNEQETQEQYTQQQYQEEQQPLNENAQENMQQQFEESQMPSPPPNEQESQQYTQGTGTNSGEQYSQNEMPSPNEGQYSNGEQYQPNEQEEQYQNEQQNLSINQETQEQYETASEQYSQGQDSMPPPPNEEGNQGSNWEEDNNSSGREMAQEYFEKEQSEENNQGASEKKKGGLFSKLLKKNE
ncbi:MAG: hypothetical protein ACOCQX_00695 [Candidatus Nanoarchaeia archaeon]